MSNLSASTDDIIRIFNTGLNLLVIPAIKLVWDIKKEISAVGDKLKAFELLAEKRFLTKRDFWRAQDDDTRKRIKWREAYETDEDETGG